MSILNNQPQAAAEPIDAALILDSLARSDASEALIRAITGSLCRLAVRGLAHRPLTQPLQARILVHDIWAQIADQVGTSKFEMCGRFHAAAAESARRILVDRARRKRSGIPGHGSDDADALASCLPARNADEFLLVHEALDFLARQNTEKAALVKLHYFLGVPFDEAAILLGISVATAHRDWVYARAWLHAEIKEAAHTGPVSLVEVIAVSSKPALHESDRRWAGTWRMESPSDDTWTRGTWSR